MSWQLLEVVENCLVSLLLLQQSYLSDYRTQARDKAISLWEKKGWFYIIITKKNELFFFKVSVIPCVLVHFTRKL